MPGLRRLLLSCLVSALSFASSSCTYTRSFSQTNVPRERGRLVEATIKKYIVLGFSFDNDDVLQLTRKLQEQCPGGAIRGVMTEDLTTLYLLIFFWARETHAQGFCSRTSVAGEQVEPSLTKAASDGGDWPSLEPEIAL